ncbi:UNVERIFIED_CONTAM: hypothetical protein FKN15_013819, partial [Acipenser sinensis]
YYELNRLMGKLARTPFTVLAFPCNQFGLQEPEENYETLNIPKYVRPGGGFIPKFQVIGKIEVNRAKEDPLYTFFKGKCFVSDYDCMSGL